MAIFQNISRKLVPEFWILLELRMMAVVVTTGAKKNMQSSSQKSPSVNSFLQVDDLPVVQPTVSEHWWEKVSHSTDLFTPSSPGVFQPRLWMLKAVGWQPSRQPSDASTPFTHTHTLHFNDHFSRWTWVSRLPFSIYSWTVHPFGTSLNFPRHS